MKTHDASDPVILPGDAFYLIDSEFDADVEVESELRFLNGGDAVIHGNGRWHEEDDAGD